MSSMQARAPKRAASVKTMIAIFAGGVLAGLIAVLPLILPDEEPTQAGQSVAAASTDGRASADTPPTAEPAEDPCAGQTWPYIDGACADAKAAQDTRQVRVISTDRAAPTTLATPAPRIDPKPVRQTAAPAPAPEPAQQPAPAAAPAKTEQPVTAAQKTASAAAEHKPSVASGAPTAHTATPEPASAQAEPAEAKIEPVAEKAHAATPAAHPAAHDAKPSETKATETKAAETKATEKPRRTKTVTVTSKSKRARPAAQPTSEEPEMALARGRTRPVADPGNSLGGPTIVRTYEYADGRRVTVYQRAGTGRSGSQALAYGGDEPSVRRVIVPFDGY